MSRSVLVFGAGGIGLAFVGQLFSRSGYRVVVSDIDEAMLERIDRHRGYTVASISPDGRTDEIAIGGGSTVSATDTEALRSVLAEEPRPVLATAVGLRGFSAVLKTLSIADPEDRPLSSFDLIAAENIHGPAEVARKTVGDNAPAVHGCAVGKMVPRRTTEELADRDARLRIRCEAFNTLYVDGDGWKNTKPDDVEGLSFVSPITAWLDRKLYIHNLGHSACAWLARAHDPSIVSIAEAIQVPAVRDATLQVMMRAAEVVAALWPRQFDSTELAEHVEDLIHRFENRALGDTVERVGQDIRRKLGKDERLVGAMYLAAKTHPAALPGLGSLYRAAARFGVKEVSDNSEDQTLAEEQIDTRLVSKLSGVDPSDPDGRSVIGAIIDGRAPAPDAAKQG
jgi:mannitol-1-phosphate 5-dehydrogenase